MGLWCGRLGCLSGEEGFLSIPLRWSDLPGSLTIPGCIRYIKVKKIYSLSKQWIANCRWPRCTEKYGLLNREREEIG